MSRQLYTCVRTPAIRNTMSKAMSFCGLISKYTKSQRGHVKFLQAISTYIPIFADAPPAARTSARPGLAVGYSFRENVASFGRHVRGTNPLISPQTSNIGPSFLFLK
jgi:hypothetical protein